MVTTNDTVFSRGERGVSRSIVGDETPRAGEFQSPVRSSRFSGRARGRKKPPKGGATNRIPNLSVDSEILLTPQGRLGILKLHTAFSRQKSREFTSRKETRAAENPIGSEGADTGSQAGRPR